MGRIGLAVVLVAALAGLLSGCGAGQRTQTAEQVAASPGAVGAVGAVGSIRVRDAAFAWTGSVQGGAVYQPGQDAPLQVTIVNEANLDSEVDALVSVSSPMATAGRIVGDARIPGGQTLTAGYDQPRAAVDLPGTRSVQITLVGLHGPIRAGISYPVVFTFARAGELRLKVPVENPDQGRESPTAAPE